MAHLFLKIDRFVVTYKSSAVAWIELLISASLMRMR